MPSVAKYRRVWFSLLREMGIAEEDRHWLQDSLTGKRSTGDWTARDWSTAIARLQRDAGLHGDQHAHVREDRPGGVAPEDGHLATDSQAAYIESLCDRIAWRTDRRRGPWLFLSRRILRGDQADLRRAVLRKAREDGAEGQALWRLLSRNEASLMIRALRRQAAATPAEETHHGP